MSPEEWNSLVRPDKFDQPRPAVRRVQEAAIAAGETERIPVLPPVPAGRHRAARGQGAMRRALGTLARKVSA